jgi:hypothetical protein
LFEIREFRNLTDHFPYTRIPLTQSQCHIGNSSETHPLTI